VRVCGPTNECACALLLFSLNRADAGTLNQREKEKEGRQGLLVFVRSDNNTSAPAVSASGIGVAGALNPGAGVVPPAAANNSLAGSFRDRERRPLRESIKGRALNTPKCSMKSFLAVASCLRFTPRFLWSLRVSDDAHPLSRMVVSGAVTIISHVFGRRDVWRSV
jgi:hypothetical protein